MKQIFIVSLLGFSSLSVQAHQCLPITSVEIDQAQQEWAKGIINIGKSKTPEKDANIFIQQMYDFDNGTVLFKPTKASQHPFRNTKEDALSYFVGGKYDEDKGFALSSFEKITFNNNNMYAGCNDAYIMGNYTFTDKNGINTNVEYTFGYIREDDKLKIKLHHSSIPYQN
ncbi:TPA: hypothetical protein ACX6QT_001090 [Photobacterium damselae]